MKDTLLIGYGNENRGDDGIGPAIARLVEALRLPNVRILVLHQLAPELAQPLSTVDRVLFIDASAAPQDSPIVIQPLLPEDTGTRLTHAWRPETLLHLSRLLYGRSPPAWMVKIQGLQFEPGDALSDLVQQHVRDASQMIATCLRCPAKLPQLLEPTP